tara:strand:+ start:1808 stop:3787 length:1980 start_codon:yes stop_codon:yes gene_type:complete
MKKIALLLFMVTLTINAKKIETNSHVDPQEKRSTKMGQTTLKEVQMVRYDKDTLAGAVVLYEHANYYTSAAHEYQSKTDYYYRIKIFDTSEFDLATIALYLYKKKKLLSLKAITYNLNKDGLMEKNSLKKSEVFETEESEDYRSIKFTLPNIKQGSVIEYSYSMISPYLSIPDWKFQSDIPKMRSEFDASILGNYEYHIRTIGIKKLDKEESSVKKNCIYVEGIGQGDCVIYSTGLYNVPAFKEEQYMLSKKNYLARLVFDLKTSTTFRGQKTDHSKTWENADKGLKKYFFNKQTSKKGYFKKRLPKAILNTQNKLERTKKVFHFIRNHFTWNEKNWTNEEVKVKNAFSEKSGDVGSINLSLYNSLLAANIEAKLVVLSTRDNGLPTKLYPIIFDFNYVIVKVVLDGNDYFLDATDKYLDFGEIPYRCLNGDGRVLDFKKGSYWQKILPRLNSSKSISSKLVLEEDGNLTGDMIISRVGYFAAQQREKISMTSEETYLEDLETEYSNLEIVAYAHENLDVLSKPLVEKLKINLETELDLDANLRINPFFFDKIGVNPFKLKERNYLVDFGYPRKLNYAIKLTIPEGYTVENLPKKMHLGLPNKGGRVLLSSKVNGNTIAIYLRINIRKKIYTEQDYFYLKEFFNRIIQAEKSYISLIKK